ncbi:phosphate acetyltransferase [Pararhodobacter sp. SW119]|uniref:phosphate acetyltransferase n=1 Tax=Pararhodobacter sp. SW119 TaxID=2780075 RepID=UPI001AE05316|nr:phosphate acetyltransferase [Pararhodobacter sp. SW119]
MEIDQTARTSRSFSRDDLAQFARMAGVAPGDTVPEPLIGALFSYLLGVELPGFGTNYLKQELRFHDSAPADEPLTAEVRITRLRPEKHLVDLATTCHDSAGRLICEGSALVLVKDVKR